MPHAALRLTCLTAFALMSGTLRCQLATLSRHALPQSLLEHVGQLCPRLCLCVIRLIAHAMTLHDVTAFIILTAHAIICMYPCGIKYATFSTHACLARQHILISAMFYIIGSHDDDEVHRLCVWLSMHFFDW